MKKNWKETLKLWLGALLFLAESATIGCKKLPKKAVALCVAVALVVAMVPVAVGAAETTNYDIWVEGTQVTSENQSNVLGKTGWNGATVTYDPTTNTLTLNYAALKSSNGTYNYYGNRYVIFFGANAPANPILMVNGICSIVAESSDKTIIGIGASQVNLTIQKANSSSTLGIRVESTKEYNHGSSAYGIEAGNQLIFDGANVSVVTNGTARLTNGIFVMNYNSPVVTIKNGAYLNLSASGTATNNYALNYNAGGTLTIDDTSTAIFQSDDADCISTGISLNKDSEGNYTQIILADANKDGVMETHTSKPRNPYASRIEVHPAVKVTLDLSSAGGTSQELYWAKGVKFPEPSAPSIKGYVFEGWYTSSNYTTAFNFNQNLNTNTTIYANFVSYESDKKELSDAIDDLQTAVTALQTAVADKADTATVNAAIAELQTAINALETAKNNYVGADDALRTELEGKIATAKGEAISAAETLVNNAKAELQTKIDAKADAATTTAAIQNLQAAVAALEAVKDDYATADATLKAELEGKIANAQTAAISAAETLVNNAKAELTAAINNKADIATLNAKINELNTAIATAEATAKAYTDGAAAALTTAIATAKSEAISAAETLVNNAKSELQSAIDTKADAATVNAAIANLQNAITALENAKNNYVSADAALKAELEAAITKAKQEAIDAAKGHIPYIGTNGNWWIGDTDTGVDANGIKGDTGNGIASITTKKENGVTTVTITFTDPEKEPVVFTISDGEAGATGADGVGVAKVEKTATNGNVDTYTITLTNGKTYTFTVTNGKDGADGKDGENGKDGLTPFIGENGNWWIGDTDTGVKAVAEQTAQKGTDTITVVSIVVASVALLSNLALVVWIVTKKKKVLV